MRAFVFTDERLSGHAGQFVWLSIDTEREKNAAVVEKYPVNAWPSFFVVDPKSEKVVMRQVGSFTATEMAGILDDGRAAMAARADAAPHEKLLAEADALYGAGDYAGAATAFEKVLPQIPKKDPSYVRALGSYLFTLTLGDRYLECAKVCKERLGDVPPAVAGGLGASGLDCALSLEKEVPERKALVAHFEEAVGKSLAAAKDGLSGDDVSGIYQVLIAAREDAGDEKGKAELEGQWSMHLDAAAAAAPDAEGRTVFDSHRLAAYIAIGHPEKAVPMLEASEKELPEDYNPPARLAVAYKELKKYDEALAASDRALKKVYGPRKLVVLRARAEIQTAKGDIPAARKTLDDAIAFAGTLPEKQGKGWIERLTKQRDGLTAPPSS